MSNAICMGLKGFQDRNRVSGNDQEVIALIEGDEEAIADFKALVESKSPNTPMYRTLLSRIMIAMS